MKKLSKKYTVEFEYRHGGFSNFLQLRKDERWFNALVSSEGELLELHPGLMYDEGHNLDGEAPFVCEECNRDIFVIPGTYVGEKILDNHLAQCNPNRHFLNRFL